MSKGIIEDYRSRIPLAADAEIISLQEGDTPLLRCENIEKLLGNKLELYVKYEGLNPTGSFKDRGMTVAISQAVYEGAKAVICASTGNTSASAAAYAAREGLKAFVLIPEGKIALGKLSQAVMHGAKIIQITGNFDQGMQIVKSFADAGDIAIVNSINPYRLQGQKTAAFEIVDELGRAPDYHCLPVGNAGNISAYWMGYTEYYRDKIFKQPPRMLGYQASGAAPFIHGQPVEHPETVATAIRIGHPQSWNLANRAQQESLGWFSAFSDDEILQAQKLLAEAEGIFCEPASAVSIAGMMHDMQQGKIADGSLVVCTLTGHGLKDPDIALQSMQDDFITVEAELGAVEKIIFG